MENPTTTLWLSRDCSCNEQFCYHLLCNDEDWLADMDDLRADRGFHRTLWRFFCHPEIKASLGDKVAIYESRLARCQRLTEKRKQIQDEMEAKRREHFKMLGCPEPDDLGTRDPEEVKRSLLMKLRNDFNAGKWRKRIVLKARKSSGIEEQGSSSQDNSNGSDE